MSDSSVTMGDTVVVPTPYRELSSEFLLVSEWIDGTKLSKINTQSEAGKDTVRKLTRVLLNSYLVQLLETGMYICIYAYVDMNNIMYIYIYIYTLIYIYIYTCKNRVSTCGSSSRELPSDI
jgi:hypothetical protein